MSVGLFTQTWRAKFYVKDHAIYADVYAHYERTDEIVEGMYQRGALVGAIEFEEGGFRAVHWKLITSDRVTTVSREKLPVLEESAEALIEVLNKDFGRRQDILETLVH